MCDCVNDSGAKRNSVVAFSDAVPTELQSDRAIRLLREEIDRLESDIGNLGMKLEPVMRDEPPTCQSDESPDEPSGSSHLMCNIDDVRRNVYHIHLRLVNMISRMEV